MASQGAHPACLFLALTLLVTAAGTVILCTAILTNYWEIITFDKSVVEDIAGKHNNTHTLHWLWGGKVAKVSIQVNGRTKVRRDVGLTSRGLMNPQKLVRGSSSSSSHTHMIRYRRRASQIIHLVPMHGGIWTLCVGLSESEQKELNEMGFQMQGCLNYLTPPHSMDDNAERDNNWVQSKSISSSQSSSSTLSALRKALSLSCSQSGSYWVTRMQNLSISCALVCCILLAASAVVGTFGIIQRQISAVLITGVMYILASTFGLFCLTIMHFKRKTKKDCGILDSQTKAMPEYNRARVFETGWSLDLGWGGVITCMAAALLWLLLARIMRYNPISLS